VFSRVLILVLNLLIVRLDCETCFASPHLLETNNLSQSVLVVISPVFGIQTANDSLVSQDDKTASGDKNSDICPTLINFIATLEQ
jgi:hypothetical protein